MFEAMFSPLGLLAAAVTLIVYLYYRVGYLPYQTFKRCGIKGPEPLPFIGNIIKRRKMGILKFLEHLYAKYGPVSGFYSGYMPTVVVTDLDIIKQIMVKKFENFHDRDNIFDLREPPGLAHARGEPWKTARQTLSPSFSAAKLRMMVPLMKKSSDTLLEKFKEFADSGKSYDMVRIYGSFSLEVILAVAFGRVVNIQRGEADALTEVVKNLFSGSRENTILRNVVELIGRGKMRPLIRVLFRSSKIGKHLEFLRSTMLGVIQARKQSKQTSNYKDLLQLMIDTTGEEKLEEGEGEQAVGGKVKRRPLTNEEIVAYSVGFLLAGYETTASTLSYVSYLLALNPEAQEKLQNEIDNYFEQNPEASMYSATQEIQYLDMVIQESLRIFPPAPQTVRVCQKEVVINGVTFPENCAVILPIKLIHHLPQYWSDPDKFDPERFTAEEKAKRHQYSHLPFGYGPRSCIGMRLALLEAKMALIETLRKFSFIQAPETEIPLQTVVGVTMSPKNGLYLRIVARD